MSPTPIYDQVRAEHGWSPEDLSEPFDQRAEMLYASMMVAMRFRLADHLRTHLARKFEEAFAEVDS